MIAALSCLPTQQSARQPITYREMRSPTAHRLQLWVRQPYLQMAYVARRTFTGGLGSLTIRCINCNAYRCDTFRMWVGGRGNINVCPGWHTPLSHHCSLQRYERHRKVRNGWHAWRLRDHPGLSATWQRMNTFADREHVMKTLRSDKGICVNNLTISVVTWGWSASSKSS